MANWYGYRKPLYQPAMRVITNITNAFPAVVTTGIPHLYINQMIVRIDVPNNAGMYQINQRFGPITVLSSTTFSIPIDTTQCDPFILTNPPVAQAVPFGEDNSILTAAVQNVSPGGTL